MLKHRNLIASMYDKGVVCLPGKGGYPAGIMGYTNYSTDTHTLEQIFALFEKNPEHDQICYLCGTLEVLDFDLKNDIHKNSYDVFKHKLLQAPNGQELLNKALIVLTKSKGYHWIYTTYDPKPSTILAGDVFIDSGLTKQKPFIEVRGKQGLATSYPTEPYQLVQGDILNPPYFSPEEILQLHNIAISLDRRPEKLPKIKRNGDFSLEYTESVSDMVSLLEKHGWTILRNYGNRVYLNRPGARTKNTDADVMVVDGRPVFRCYSGSEAFDTDKGYDYFGVYGMLEFAGDFKNAFKAYKGIEDNYPRLGKAPEMLPAESEKAETKPDFENEINSIRFIYGAPMLEPKANFRFKINGIIHDVGCPTDFGGIIGLEKSRKSTVASTVAACAIRSALNNGMWIGPISYIHVPNTNILWFDTEHSTDRFNAMQYKVYEQAGQNKQIPVYEAFKLTKYSVHDRFNLIEYALQKYAPVSLVIIDGLVDLCLDFNNSEKSMAAISKVRQLQEMSGANVINLLHTNKTDRNARGHLGSMLQQKADWVIEVRKNEDVDNESAVLSKVARYKPFPAFDVKVDDNNIIISEDYEELFSKDTDSEWDSVGW